MTERSRSPGSTRTRSSSAPNAARLAPGTKGQGSPQGDVLVFIDSDTEIQPDYLETVGKAFTDKELIACSCAFKFSGRDPKLLLAESVTNTYYLGRSLFRGTTLPGFNVCIRRDAFEKLHGFRLCHLEDLDMSIKLRRMGRTRYLPRRKAITSSRRIETDGLRGTLKYYADLFEQTQGRRLGFEPIKLRRTEYKITCSAIKHRTRSTEAQWTRMDVVFLFGTFNISVVSIVSAVSICPISLNIGTI